MYVSGVEGGRAGGGRGRNDWPLGRQLTMSMSGIHLSCSFSNRSSILTLDISGRLP